MAVSARFLTTPLGVDLHGMLVRSDVLLESLLLLLKQNPLYLFLALAWLLRGGKAGLAAQLASRVRLNPAALLYNADLVAWLDGGTVHPLRPHDELWRNPRYRAVFQAAAGPDD